MNRPKKPECYDTWLERFARTNTQAYWAHMLQRKLCCEHGPLVHQLAYKVVGTGAHFFYSLNGWFVSAGQYDPIIWMGWEPINILCVCVFHFYNSRSTHCYVHVQQLHIEFFVIIRDDHEHAGRVISNGREPRSCLGRVFNIKLDSFASKQHNCMVHTHNHFQS